MLKDFTTVLEMRREDRQTILAQLREIYDGRYDKTWGTGRELRWEGRLGFVAGVTPIIDKHQAAMSILGERFVLFRPIMPDRKQLAMAALKSRGREREMREDLARAMHGFLAARGSAMPEVSAAVLDRVATVADFVTRARSGVQRDGFRRELEYAPEPEAPTRFAKVLLSLASGIALAYDSPEITGRELGLVLRVALDCLPLIRHRVIAALVEETITADADGRLSTSAIAGTAQLLGYRSPARLGGPAGARRRGLPESRGRKTRPVGAGRAVARGVPGARGGRSKTGPHTGAGNGRGDGSPDVSETVRDTVSETSVPPSQPDDGDVGEVLR